MDTHPVAPASSPAAPRLWLRVGLADGIECAIELGESDTLVPLPPLTRPGRTPPLILGLGNFHGTPRTVVDASEMLGHGRTLHLEEGSALLLSSASGWRIGLGLERTLGLLQGERGSAIPAGGSGPASPPPALWVTRQDLEPGLRGLDGVVTEALPTSDDPLAPAAPRAARHEAHA